MTQTVTNPHISRTQTSKPRVLQVITHLGLGGAERVCFTLMRGLQSQFDFEVFAVRGIENGPVGRQFHDELREMKIPLHTGTKVPIKFGGMALAGWALRRAVKKCSPQIIHLHTEIPESSYASMIAMSPSLSRIPLVRTVHNTVLWVPWRKLGRWCENRMKRSHIAAVSVSAIEAYHNFRADTGAGTLPSEPRLIVNGVSVPAPRPGRSYRSDRPVRILFAGRFEEQKGADLLPQIVRLVKLSAGRTIELVLHGHGTYEEQIRMMAAHAPKGWTITVNGPVPNLTQLMQDYDLLIMPSRFEGLSLVAMESLLQSVPVVATRAPGLKDGFPTDYPWLAEPGDAASYAAMLQKVLEIPETWDAIATNARQFALERFDVSVMCRSYSDLYGDVLNLKA